MSIAHRPAGAVSQTPAGSQLSQNFRFTINFRHILTTRQSSSIDARHNARRHRLDSYLSVGGRLSRRRHRACAVVDEIGVKAHANCHRTRLQPIYDQIGGWMAPTAQMHLVRCLSYRGRGSAGRCDARRRSSRPCAEAGSGSRTRAVSTGFRLMSFWPGNAISTGSASTACEARACRYTAIPKRGRGRRRKRDLRERPGWWNGGFSSPALSPQDQGCRDIPAADICAFIWRRKG